jgi:hypothetical protein
MINSVTNIVLPENCVAYVWWYNERNWYDVEVTNQLTTVINDILKSNGAKPYQWDQTNWRRPGPEIIISLFDKNSVNEDKPVVRVNIWVMKLIEINGENPISISQADLNRIDAVLSKGPKLKDKHDLRGGG